MRDRQLYCIPHLVIETTNVVISAEGVQSRLQVAGNCVTPNETTQTFTKMLTLGLNIIFLYLMLALVKVWVVSAVMKH